MITFTPFTPEHLPHYFAWSKKDHVTDFWFMEGYEPPEYIHKRIEGNGYDYPFVIILDGRPIGYIQYGDLYAYRTLCPDPKGVFTNEPEGTFCVDLFIGEEDCINRGLGTETVSRFCAFLFQKPECKRIVIDPAADNARAIRCYEKVGFRRLKTVHDGINSILILELTQ